jgi:putative ABC transport system permease protein
MLNAIRRTYRSLLKRPAFLLAVVFTLMLGIGANSSIFSVIDAVLLKPLPYPSGDRLMALFESNPRKKVPHGMVAPVRVEEWNRLNHTFTGIAGAYTENVAETSGALPEMLLCSRVSARFFSVLGTSPLIGRIFSPEEELENGPYAAVLSERLWRRRFGADPNILGKQLMLGRGGHPIIGVVPDSVRFPAINVDFWIPSKLPAVVMRSREARFDITVGRLKEGVSMQAAQADLAAVQGNLALQYPATDQNWTAIVEPLKEGSVGGVRQSLWILFGAVSLVLLIACANVACLLLAQANRRGREIAVRFSLGARRGQVIRELLLEAFCLAIPGSLLGLGLALAGSSLFRRAATMVPRADEIHLDWRIVLFTLSLSVVTTVLFGMIPSIRATRNEVAGVLAQGSRTEVQGRHALERLLVAGQIALAIVLLVGSGLLIRTLSRLGRVSLGFEPEHVLAFRVSASWGEVSNNARVALRLYRTLEVVRTIPGVEGSAITIGLPGGGEAYAGQFKIVGRDTDLQGEKLFADMEVATPEYFRVLGIPMLAGHTCEISLDSKTPRYILVSNSFAQRFFPGQSPIGHHITTEGNPTPTEVIAVVSDVRRYGYAKDPKPVLYFCGLPGYFPGPQYLLRTSGDPMRVAEAVREKVRSIEPSRAVYDTKRLSDHVASSLTTTRFQTMLLTSFALTALLLAAIGLYGVTSFLVSQRTREIGLRVALGAQPRQIFAQIVRQGAVMTGAGVTAGLIAAAILSRSIASLLFGVAPVDPITFVAVPLVLSCVAAAALWPPAHRATRVDPIDALRQE